MVGVTLHSTLYAVTLYTFTLDIFTHGGRRSEVRNRYDVHIFLRPRYNAICTGRELPFVDNELLILSDSGVDSSKLGVSSLYIKILQLVLAQLRNQCQPKVVRDQHQKCHHVHNGLTDIFILEQGGVGSRVFR